jgi:ribosomal protein S18 acetylase RimI-like enzyme
MGSSATIRRIRADEADGLREVRLAALARDPKAFGSTYARELAYEPGVWAKRAAEGAGDRDGAIFIAEAADAPVGMVMVRLEAEDERRAHIYGLWVAPESRRAGLGWALTQATIDWARDRGAVEITLTVVAANEGAALLYRRLGFRETGRTMALGRDPSVLELEMAMPLR